MSAQYTSVIKYQLYLSKTGSGFIVESDLSTITYFGKIFMVGTWHFIWKTLGQRSQHSRLPPLIQTAHQSSLGSSSFPPEFAVSADAPFPFVSGMVVMLLWFSADNEVVDVRMAVEGAEVAAPEPFSPEQEVSEGGSVLMCSPKALSTSWPVDAMPKTGRGLFSGLLI